jgi:uncharacterized protein (DUF2267 family)
MDQEKFFHEVRDRFGVDQEQAKKVTGAVLQELRDRLTPGEAADLNAQLPVGLRELWQENDFPGREVRRDHKAEFIRRVADIAGIPEDQASRALTAVFSVLQMLLKSPTGQEGEAWDIFSQLPKDLKKVWLAAARPARAKRA